MKDDPRYLEDIVNNIRYCQDFLAGVSRREFEKDRRLQYAVSRAIEIVGEAASKLTPGFKAKHTDVPWSDMVRTRNRLIHNYGIVDTNGLWEAAKVVLPKLSERLSGLLGPPDNGDMGGPGAGGGPTGGTQQGDPSPGGSTRGPAKPGSSRGKRPTSRRNDSRGR